MNNTFSLSFLVSTRNKTKKERRENKGNNSDNKSTMWSYLQHFPTTFDYFMKFNHNK